MSKGVRKAHFSRAGVQSTRFLGFSASLRLLKAYPQTGVLFNAALAAAGAFPGLIGLMGLMGLIGQRLTEWQALFNFFFRGAAPALRFSG